MYRKYRPTTFDDVIGQEHITKTLTNQIKNDMVGHAYLFTGSRGTGKTTCAKIFAKAVNCLTPINGSPCSKCAACVSLSDPSNIDILEIDAASNNKVDEIRELRERIKYPPVIGKLKVYIIDEVHMLTDSAFNALLKTLEEPPSHAMFILATTEVHKLPATILSRCMRFDFRLVSQELLAMQVKKIYDLEHKKYQEEAVNYIAMRGEGSVRDALSIADMCLNISTQTLTLEQVQDVLGAADRSKIQGLFSAIADNNVGQVLGEISALAALGKSINVIAKDLISYVRDVLAVKSGMEKLVIDTAENMKKLREFAALYHVPALATIIQILSAAEQDLRYSNSPKITLECTALRACMLISVDCSALEARIAALERGGANVPTQQMPSPPIAPEAKKQSVEPTDARAIWGRIISYLRKNESMAIYSLCGNHEDYQINENKLIIYTSSGSQFLEFSDDQTIGAITRALRADSKNFEVTVLKRGNGIDMDEEIARLKPLIGDAPLIIKK